MFTGKMKFVIALLLISFSVSLKIQKQIVNSAVTPMVGGMGGSMGGSYIASPVTYVPSPSYMYSYLYDPYYYPYYSYYTNYYPSYYSSYYRKSDSENTEKSEQKEAPKKRELTLEEAEKEMKMLKKMIFNDENFSTEEIKKNKKYEAKWLINELKITRAFEIQDVLKMMDEKKSTSKSSRKEEAKVATSTPLRKEDATEKTVKTDIKKSEDSSVKKQEKIVTKEDEEADKKKVKESLDKFKEETKDSIAATVPTPQVISEEKKCDGPDCKAKVKDSELDTSRPLGGRKDDATVTKEDTTKKVEKEATMATSDANCVKAQGHGSALKDSEDSTVRPNDSTDKLQPRKEDPKK